MWTAGGYLTFGTSREKAALGVVDPVVGRWNAIACEKNNGDHLLLMLGREKSQDSIRCSVRVRR